MATAPMRILRATLAAGALLLVMLFFLICFFPVSALKGVAERRLADRFGAPVRIGGIDRETRFSLHPVIRLTAFHVAQQHWAGKGDMASIGLVRLRLDVLPLVIGRLEVEPLTVRDARLDLVRASDRRRNWSRDGGAGGAAAPYPPTLTIEGARIRYRDAVQNRWFALDVHVDPRTGLTARGAGAVDGTPVAVRIEGGPLFPDARWPFKATIDGPQLAMQVRGEAAGPLRLDRMTFHVAAQADDLKRVDRVIEAGLFGTQRVTLAADVRREPGVWQIDRLHGTVGRSDLTGHLVVRKAEDRTKLDGAVRFGHLDFDDLASDRDQAQALALQREQGLRLVPDMRVNIRKIVRTDGRIAVEADRIEGGRRPSTLTALSAVLTLDHRLLTVAPLRLELRRGAITGKAVVDQRSGVPEPEVLLALDMKDSSILAVAGEKDRTIDARLDARARLSGRGSTIREAVGHADGRLGIVARSGVLPEKVAGLMGFDIGKGLLGGGKHRVALRCGVLGLTLRDGVGVAGPLLADTSISQTRGTGTIRFPDETLDLVLTGAPKEKAALRLPGTVNLRGTIRSPDIQIPRETRSIRNIAKAVGRSLFGRKAPLPDDAECPALIEKTLGKTVPAVISRDGNP